MRYAIIIIFSFCLLAVACSRGDLSFDERASKAEAHIGLGNYVAALHEYNAIAKDFKDDPRHVGILLRIADLHATNLGNTEAALKKYGEVIDENPLSQAAREARERRAVIREQMNDYEGAIEDYSALLKHFGNDSRNMHYRILVAGVYLSMKDYRQAKVEIKPILEDPQVPKDILEQAIFLAAESYFLEGKNKRASGYYRWLLEEFPESKLASEAKLHLATCYEEMGYLGVAGYITESAAKDYPNRGVVDARLKSLKERGKGSVDDEAKKDIYKPKELR
ncbi:MAG: tetratricopeptide repeat protein [Pseudomonadota bacterium]